MLKINDTWRCTWAHALSSAFCGPCVSLWAGSSTEQRALVCNKLQKRVSESDLAKQKSPLRLQPDPSDFWPHAGLLCKQRPLSSQLPLGFKRGKKKKARHFLLLLLPPPPIPSACAGYPARSTLDINKYKSLGAQHQQFQCSEALEVQSLMQKSEATTVYSKLLRLIRQPWRIISREDLDQWQRQSEGALFTGLG